MFSRLKLRNSGLRASDLRGKEKEGGAGLQELCQSSLGRRGAGLTSVRATHRGGGAGRDIEERHSTLGAVGKREVFWD